MQRASLELLPVETLIDIFTRLPRKDQYHCQYHCALVSKQLSPVALHVLWQHVDFKLYPENNPLADGLNENNHLFERFSRTVRLSLDFSVCGGKDQAPNDPTLSEIVRNYGLCISLCAKLPEKMDFLSIQFEPFGLDDVSDLPDDGIPPDSVIYLLDAFPKLVAP
jgi:hypothetical protein